MKSKRILSLILAFLMLFSILPFYSLAEEDGLDEQEITSDEDAYEVTDSFADQTVETQGNDALKEQENEAVDEPLETSGGEENEEEGSIDEFPNTDENLESEETSQESGIPIEEESEDAVEPDEVTEDASDPDDISFEEGPEERNDTDEDKGKESQESSENETEDDIFHSQEPNTEPDDDFSLDDLVLTEYDGSYIWYTIDNYGHAYVRTKQETTVYQQISMNPDTVLCTLPDGEIVLATDYDNRTGSNAVYVIIVNPEMDVLDGYINESDLSKVVVEDEEIDSLTVEHDYILIDINSDSYPALVSATSFLGSDFESNGDREEQERYDDQFDPASDETFSDESDQETIMIDTEKQDIQPIRLMATRGYSYTMYVEHDPPILFSTRPVGYMAGNRQGFTTLDEGLDGSELGSIHQSYNLKGQYLTILGMGRYHHAVVKVEWYDSSANMTRTLLTEAAYLRPVEQTYGRAFCHGRQQVHPAIARCAALPF